MSIADTWPHLADEVRAWIDDDPDQTTADELRALLAAGDEGDDEARRELADRFAGLLQFGTAGLRGALGGGPNRMNRAVVVRAAAGLGRFLLDELARSTYDEHAGDDDPTGASAAAPPRVVVGYDARHRSADFAADTAAVLTAAGAEVLLMPWPLPTPVLAFAVRHLAADAGVMVTASHNPAADNGYKVYLGGRVVTGPGQGAQIVPPTDVAIADRIAAVPSVTSVARAASGWTVLDETIVDAYAAAVAALVPDDDIFRGRAAAVRIVLTPMHGVGGDLARRVLAAAGFTDVTIVPEQAAPDPDFPTVAFPNPEEPGALDLALGLARERGAHVVLALDPDADRCAVAVDDPRAGGWRALHGDETGALLGADAAARAAAERLAGRPGTGDTLAASIVSSRLLARIAAGHGLRFAATLTGFKWIARTPGLVFGYEEALGYCVAPDLVRDKDGISAALVVARLAADLLAAGRTPLDALDDLARRHGLHLTGQLSARFDDPAAIEAAVARLRANPPTHLAGAPVVAVQDLAAGSDEERGGLPPTEGLRLLAADDTRVVVRPSGTEPKVKCYLEVIEALDEDASYDEVTAARTRARTRLDTLAREIADTLGLPG
jgi:phosphomannomutase